ncbi:MAG: aldo/keto reductase [Erysipelotrichaceae bacterium]|nr:aldo/keto reductase [Erysipelotrichaceae bacterium]
MKKSTDTYKLHNGIEVPIIGFGTWQIKDPKIAYESVLNALQAGYRHIDTAAIYGNEEAVGKAINDSKIPRSEIFLTTKLWNDSHTYKKAIKAVDISLKKLKTDYIDLYLIHWPNPLMYRDDFENSIAETWRAMEDTYKSGKAKAIGISNFRPHHIETLLDVVNIAPMVNQIRLYPGYEMEETALKSKMHGMLLQAYSPLGSGKIFESQELQEIAKKYNKSVAQVCIRYSLQQGYNPLPKSQTKERIIENIDVFDFNLSNEDMEHIKNIPNYCGEGTDPDTAQY